MHERDVELAALGLFRSLGYDLRHGPELGPGTAGAERESLASTFLAARVRRRIGLLNPQLPDAAVESAFKTVTQPGPFATLVENNRWFHSLLVGGVPVEYMDKRAKELRGGQAALVDFDTPANNAFAVTSQLLVRGPAGSIRPDLVVFLNGLPVATIELKDPADEEANVGSAIEQLRRYQTVTPDLFTPNVVLAASDGMPRAW